MKPIALTFLAAGAAAIGQVVQPAPVPIRPPVRVVQPPAPEEPKDVARLDLDFNGGSPKSLVDALGKALRKDVNVVIDESSGKAHLPPIRVRNATVADLFAAIAIASKREVAVPMGGGSRQFRTIQSQFVPVNGPASDDTIWSFVSNEFETLQLAENANQPVRELRHFQLGEYLSDHLTVEDITTAVRTGWEMLGVKPIPDLKFHKETGILIAAGDPQLLDQIPQVLKNLPHAKTPVPPPPPKLPPSEPVPPAK